MRKIQISLIFACFLVLTGFHQINASQPLDISCIVEEGPASCIYADWNSPGNFTVTVVNTGQVPWINPEPHVICIQPLFLPGTSWTFQLWPTQPKEIMSATRFTNYPCHTVGCWIEPQPGEDDSDNLFNLEPPDWDMFCPYVEDW